MSMMTRWLGVVVLGLALGAAGQSYYWYDLEVTNNVPDNSTTATNLGSVISATRYGEIGLSASFTLADGDGTNACVFVWGKSLDGTNFWERFSWTILPNGTNATVGTNVSVSLGALGYVRLLSVSNGTNGAAMTNLVVGYAFKPARRD